MQESKELEAKIVHFRSLLKEFVTKEDMETLKNYITYNEAPEEIGALIESIDNNPIVKLYDEYFNIFTRRSMDLNN